MSKSKEGCSKFYSYSDNFLNTKTGEQIKLEIRETDERDLTNICSLWADGDVMNFVGFPEGLKYTEEKINKWFEYIRESRPETNHFSIFVNGEYVGETYYSIDKKHENLGSLDIKLFSTARGKGIAMRSLSFAIDQAFENGAEKVYVDPSIKNKKAIALYKKLGFVEKIFPEHFKNDGEQNFIYLEKSKK